MQHKITPLEKAKDQLEHLVQSVTDEQIALSFIVDETPVSTLIPYAYYEALQEIIDELINDDTIVKDICDWRLYKILFPEPLGSTTKKRGQPPLPKDKPTDTPSSDAMEPSL